MSDKEKLRNLIRWKSEDAEAVAGQLLERVRGAVSAGETVGVVVCLVRETPDGRVYEPAFSELPIEISMWAGHRIIRRIIEVNDT